MLRFGVSARADARGQACPAWQNHAQNHKKVRRLHSIWQEMHLGDLHVGFESTPRRSAGKGLHTIARRGQHQRVVNVRRKSIEQLNQPAPHLIMGCGTSSQLRTAIPPGLGPEELTKPGSDLQESVGSVDGVPRCADTHSPRLQHGNKEVSSAEFAKTAYVEATQMPEQLQDTSVAPTCAELNIAKAQPSRATMDGACAGKERQISHSSSPGTEGSSMSILLGSEDEVEEAAASSGCGSSQEERESTPSLPRNHVYRPPSRLCRGIPTTLVHICTVEATQAAPLEPPSLPQPTSADRQTSSLATWPRTERPRSSASSAPAVAPVQLAQTGAPAAAAASRPKGGRVVVPPDARRHRQSGGRSGRHVPLSVSLAHVPRWTFGTSTPRFEYPYNLGNPDKLGRLRKRVASRQLTSVPVLPSEPEAQPEKG